MTDDWRIPRSQSHFFWSPQTQTRSQRESGKIVFVLFFSWSPKTRRHHALASVEVVPLHYSDYGYDFIFIIIIIMVIIMIIIFIIIMIILFLMIKIIL